MARLRTKDFDLEPGWVRKNGRLYFYPTTLKERRQKTRPPFSIPDGPMVYFIRAKHGALKIGFTTSKVNLERRMSMLRVGCPQVLTIMGTVPGSRDDERRAHADLRLFRRQGEWFGPHRAVTAYLWQALRAGRIPDRVAENGLPIAEVEKIPAIRSKA